MWGRVTAEGSLFFASRSGEAAFSRPSLFLPSLILHSSFSHPSLALRISLAEAVSPLYSTLGPLHLKLDMKPDQAGLETPENDQAHPSFVVRTAFAHPSLGL